MAAGIDAQVASLESKRASCVAEKAEALASTRALKAALETVSAKDKKVVVAQAAQAAAEAKAQIGRASCRERVFRAV